MWYGYFRIDLASGFTNTMKSNMLCAGCGTICNERTVLRFNNDDTKVINEAKCEMQPTAGMITQCLGTAPDSVYVFENKEECKNYLIDNSEDWENEE